MEPKICQSCHFPITDTFYFCPNCGKKLYEPPITAMGQIKVYAISILLPPLGLWPGIKYVLQKDEKTRTVGIIAIILTIISTIVTVFIFMNTITSITSGGGGGGSQLNQLQNLGY